MRTVAVIMSTYNGSKNICRQLDSIFNQKGVNVFAVIRDDGSKDDTVDILKEYIKKTGNRIFIIIGKNEGYAKSFWDALYLAGDADYYAFSDQDDVWKEEKLIRTINPMEKDNYLGPKLSYCKMQRSDEKLNRLKEQVKILKPVDLSKKLCLTQTFNYGASTVFNNEARDLICRYWPKKTDVPHDLWAGILCYWFGKIFYVDQELYYWIRYNTSVTGDGTKKSGKIYRIKESLKKKSYPNIADDLLREYGDLISHDDSVFLQSIIDYHTSYRSKIKLLYDTELKRDKFTGTIALKFGILFNWF